MQDWKIGNSNRSQVFIIPMLGDNCDEFGGTMLPQCQFRNCFIGDTSKDIKDKILLLYRFHSDPLFLEFEQELEEHKLFESRYEVDKKHTMFVFSIPEEYKNDYFKIINGEYSKINDSFKKHILKFHNLKIESNTGGILYKTNNKRYKLEETINAGLPKIQWTKIPDDVELEESFNLEIECFQDKYKFKDSMTPNQEFNI